MSTRSAERAGQGHSVLAHAEPLSLLFVAFALLGGGLLIDDLTAGVVGLVVVLAVTWSAAGRGRVTWVRLLPGVLGFASVAWSNWLLADPRDVSQALVAGLRVAFFALPGVVLAGFVDPSALGDQLGQRLRLPARPVLALVVGLQQLDTFTDEWVILSRSRRVRGLGPGRSPVARIRYTAELTFALLVQATRRAERITVAMEARGYSRLARPQYRRTWAEPAPWTGYDTGVVVVGVALAVLPVVIDALT